MTTQTPARLFVLLAREAHIGVILRRGPSDWVQMIQWHTKADVFTPGQWFHGRIFEHRCDLSADGKFFVYRAFKPGNRLKNPDYGDSWTAVSTPPNFTAKALWVHLNRYGGGGYFMDDGRMLLNHLDDNRTLHPAYRLPQGLSVKTIETYEDESDYLFNNIYLQVMGRDGWNPVDTFQSKYPSSFYRSAIPQNNVTLTLAKTKGKLSLICRILNHANFKSRPNDFLMQNWAKAYATGSLRSRHSTTISHTYQYALNTGNHLLELDGVTWADFDRNKRLVLAKESKLFSVIVADDELALTELADFNESRPQQ